MERHLSEGVRGAAQAWVIRPDYGFDAIEHSLSDFRPVDEMSCYLKDALVHCQVVMACGDDEVCPLHETVFIGLVVMNEGTSRRLDASDAFPVIGLGEGTDMRAQDFGIVQELFHEFKASKYLDQPRIVVMKRAQDRPAL